MIKTKTQINSRNKIIIITGFFSVLILLGSLMVIAITRIMNNEQQIRIVTQELNEVSHAYIMRDAANNRALLLYRMAQTDDPFLRDDMFMEFGRYGSIFVTSYNKIKTSLHRQKDIDLFNITSQSIQKGGATQNNTADDIIGGQIAKVHNDLTNIIIPIQIEVRDKLTQLSISFQENADNELTSISIQNKFSIYLIGFIGSIAILLGLIITFYITHRVTKTETAVIKQRLIAEQANQAKTMFLATMSHEIRSPLAAIIGFSGILRKVNLDADKSTSCIESIHRNGQHLLQLINDVLDITKIEAGQLDIEILTTSLFTVLNDLHSAIEVSAKEKHLNFKINYVFPLPDKIKTDPVHLKQILYNLTSNAIKFTKNGGININVSFNKKTEKMIFDIIDTGIGLSPEQQHKIFNSFTQADSSTTRKFGGSGLGLNICKQLVKILGGNILVESIPERGSKFSFTISTGNVTENNLVYSLKNISAQKENSDIDPCKKLSARILLAEDTVDNQTLIEMYVTETGANVTIVENGVQAVNICSSQKFDLILMDMQMPEMDGIEATKRIRETVKETPIIFLTANAMKSDYKKCIDAGANEFLTKPIDIIRFNQVLYKYLSHSKQSTTVIKKVNKLQKLTDKFLNELPDRMAKILVLKEQQSWKKLEEETHKLKSLGTPFGLPEITEICAKINLCCRNEEFNETSKLVDQLDDFCKSI